MTSAVRESDADETAPSTGFVASACVVPRCGPPDALVWRPVHVPEPGPGEVRIRVRAAGVHPADLRLRRGLTDAEFGLPTHRILGCEVAGTVDALGPGVRGISAGTDVVAFLPELGGYAQFVNAARWTEKPAHVSWIAAAALPAAACAAGHALRSLALEPEKTLLILGAADPIGLIAAQLAVRLGINVVGTAAGSDWSTLRLAGAIPIRDDEPPDGQLESAGLRIDAVVDAASAQPFATLGAGSDGIERAMRMLAMGELRMRPQRVLPIEQAAEAHRILEAGASRHKLVLTVP